jgi:hypothetical protein
VSVYMSLCFKSKLVGVAIYDPSNKEVLWLQHDA